MRPTRTEVDGTLLILIYVIAVVVTPEFNFLGIPKVRVSDLLLIPILVYMVGSLNSVNTLKAATPLLVPFAALMLWDLIMLVQFGSLYGLFYLAKRFSYALTFVIGVLVVRSQQGWQRLVTMLLLATPILSLSVLYSINVLTPVAEAQRGSGTIAAQEGSTALFLVVLLLLTLGVLLVSRSPLLRLSSLATLALGIPALLGTGTRGALIDLLAGALVLELLRRSFKRSVLILGISLLVLMTSWAFLPNGLKERLGSTVPQLVEAWNHLDQSEDLAGGNSVAARYISNRDAFNNYVVSNPITGLGTACRPLGFTDNVYLTEWVYHGLVGLALLLFVLFRLGQMLVRAYREERNSLEKGVMAGTLAAFAAMVLAGLHSDSFYLIRPMEAFMLLAGLAVGRAGLPRPDAVIQKPARPRFVVPERSPENE